MSSINFQCRYCRQTRPVASARIFENAFIRCDACQAVNGITESERMNLVHDAGSGGASPKRRPGGPAALSH